MSPCGCIEEKMSLVNLIILGLAISVVMLMVQIGNQKQRVEELQEYISDCVSKDEMRIKLETYQRFADAGPDALRRAEQLRRPKS